jgi:uncharacterized protein YqjF (DUF2071 family)
VRGPDDEPGIYSSPLEAASAIAVAGARLGFGLALFSGVDDRRVVDDRIVYASPAPRRPRSWR